MELSMAMHFLPRLGWIFSVRSKRILTEEIRVTKMHMG